MKIQAIQGYNTTNRSSSKDTHASSFGALGGVPMGPYNDCLFSMSYWKNLKILEKTKSELIDLAEYFHKAAEDIVREACGSEKFLTIFNKDKYIRQYERLSEAIKEVIAGKEEMLARISVLEPKKALGIGNLVEQKDRVDRQFLSLLKAEKRGEDVPVTNGILVYGSSKEKEGFIEWLINSSGVVVKRFKHDSNNPMATIETIVNTAEKSETAFQHSNTRTILVVDNLDEMLTKQDGIDDIEMIGRFKGFVEHLSKDFHTTLVTKTDKALDDFEPASIAAHRFGIKADLKDGISQDELKELERLSKEVKRLDDKAKNYNKFYVNIEI